jgi:hypothetical protein
VRPFMQSLLVFFEGLDDRDAAAVPWPGARGRPCPLPAESATARCTCSSSWASRSQRRTGRARRGRRLLPDTGSTPVLVVRGAGRERLLPMSPDVLVKVDTAAGEIAVRLLPAGRPVALPRIPRSRVRITVVTIFSGDVSGIPRRGHGARGPRAAGFSTSKS